MSATNSTPNIGLPLFIGSDKPAWLVDFNGAMTTIDTAIANVQTAESGSAAALAALTQSVEALGNTVSQHTTAITTISTSVAGNTGSINTINSLIGNGEPTTQDKTLIGAINEIQAEVEGLTPGGSLSADNVTYDNEDSGLSAVNVQEAIDEVADAIPSIASEVQRGVLASGATTVVLTFTDQTIGTNTLVDVYSGTYGVNPTNVATTANTVTLTFDAQSAAVLVAVKVQN